MTIQALLNKEHITEADFLRLLSEEAGEKIELLAQRANRITEARFGKKIQLYVPLYLSNHCNNDCSYCGFRSSNKTERKRLSLEEIDAEAEILFHHGFRHLLLVAGEDNSYITTSFLIKCATLLRKRFPFLSVEVAPQSREGYKALAEAGIDGVVSYQETYQKEVYARIHPKGPKTDYNYRYNTAARAAEAGIRKVGIGFLVGAAEWKKDASSLFRHLKSLINSYWQTEFTISFPRFREAEGIDSKLLKEHTSFFQQVSDREYVQLITAFRIAFPDTGIVLSTRENATLRNNLIPLGITQMSAGSKTEPGGYNQKKKSGTQFEIEDTRSPEEVAEAIKAYRYEPVWKDWTSLKLTQ